MSSLSSSLLSHQYDFVSDLKTPFIALCGGYGSGKTVSLCMKAINLAQYNLGFRGMLLEPTYGLIEDILQPTLEDCLEVMEIPYKSRSRPYPQFTLRFKHGNHTILLRSLENYKRLIGVNLAYFGVDEIDIGNEKDAVVAWRKLQGRIRSGSIRQGFTTGSPEGFKFMYNKFYKAEKHTGYKLIRARTRDNPFIPDGYEQQMRDDFPEQLARAYLDGEFVNLVSGTVYYNFDRVLNNTNKTLEDYPHHVLHIGQDFNINKMASTIAIIDNGEPYVIDELKSLRNTDDLIAVVKEKFPKRSIVFYPDSSGKSGHTNASTTDILLLKQAGFELRYSNRNPLIKDRVGSMNAMFCNGKKERRLKVNTRTCPKLTESLEQQAYNDAGVPDKQHDQDHPVDACGYFIHNLFPLAGRPTLVTQ